MEASGETVVVASRSATLVDDDVKLAEDVEDELMEEVEVEVADALLLLLLLLRLAATKPAVPPSAPAVVVTQLYDAGAGWGEGTATPRVVSSWTNESRPG